jgi:hypothetical protein
MMINLVDGIGPSTSNPFHVVHKFECNRKCESQGSDSRDRDIVVRPTSVRPKIIAEVLYYTKKKQEMQNLQQLQKTDISYGNAGNGNTRIKVDIE